MKSLARRSVAALLLALAACDGGGAPKAPTPPPPRDAPVEDVLDARLRAMAPPLDLAAALAAEPDADGEEWRAFAEGMARAVAAEGASPAVLADVRAGGKACVVPLLALALDAEAAADVRRAALELLPATGVPEAALALALAAAGGPEGTGEPWLRRFAAWRVRNVTPNRAASSGGGAASGGEVANEGGDGSGGSDPSGGSDSSGGRDASGGSDPSVGSDAGGGSDAGRGDALAGADAALAPLLLRLKYETDGEALAWLAGSLADFGNLAGLEALAALAAGTAGPTIATDANARAAAAAELERVLAALGPDPGEGEARVALSLVGALEAWRTGTHASPEPSPALVAEIWRGVAELTGERFQLRGVDDARYWLARLGASSAKVLAEALADDDEFVRLHVCQVLDGMGPRARAGAAEALERRLADPHAAVAATAAEALASVAGARAHAALAPLTAANVEHELRVAAIRAVGRAGAEEGRASLVAIVDRASEPADVRMAAAAGLVEGPDAARALPFLLEQIDAPLGDAGAAEALLGAWLAGADGASPEHREAAEAWRALAPAGERVHEAAEVRARRAARAEIVRRLLARSE